MTRFLQCLVLGGISDRAGHRPARPRFQAAGAKPCRWLFAGGRWRGLLVVCVGLLGIPAPAAWVPPVGIPAPTFGIEETVASVYGSNTYFTYWIDHTHPDATDANNPKGTPDRPRRTIPGQLNLTSGDVVQIRGTLYDFALIPSDRLEIHAAGTAVKPIFICGPTNAPPGITNAFVQVVQASYLIVEGLKSCVNSIGIRTYENRWCDHVAFRGCEVAGGGTNLLFNGQGMGVTTDWTFTNSHVRDVVFFRNYIHDGGDWRAARENDNGGIIMGGGRTTNMWVLENTVCRAGGDGAGGGHNANFTSARFFIGRNHFFDCRENGVDIKQINDVVISENEMHGFHPVDSSSGEAVVVHYHPTNFVVVNNIIYDCSFGLYLESAWTNYIVGNLIYNIHHGIGTNWIPGSVYGLGAAIHADSVQSPWIVNNTFYDYDTGVQLTGVDDVLVLNNLFAGRTTTNGTDVMLSQFTGNPVVEYNLFAYPTNTTRLGIVDTYLASRLATVQRWNLLFRNKEVDTAGFAASGDWRLVANSAAKDQGTRAPVWERFRTYFGLSLDRDLWGANRLSGQAIDIGASEVAEPFTGTPQCAMPESWPRAARVVWPGAASLTLTNLTPGCTIFYTLDGSDPTTNSASATPPLTLTVTQRTEIRALAWCSDYEPSFVARTSVLWPDAERPVFSPASGEAVPVPVTISSATPGATIWWTTNGVPVAGAANTASGPSPRSLTLTNAATVRAMSWAPYCETSVVALATFLPSRFAKPILSPPGCQFRTNLQVTVDCATAGANIYYSLDGSDPSTNSPNGASPLTLVLTNTVWLKAVAFTPGRGLDPSSAVLAFYELTFADAPELMLSSEPGAVKVTVTSPTPGTVVHWTTNGLEPTGNDMIVWWHPPVFRFNSPVSGVTLKAKAVVIGKGWGPTSTMLLGGTNVMAPMGAGTGAGPTNVRVIR